MANKKKNQLDNARQKAGTKQFSEQQLGTSKVLTVAIFAVICLCIGGSCVSQGGEAVPFGLLFLVFGVVFVLWDAFLLWKLGRDEKAAAAELARKKKNKKKKKTAADPGRQK